MKHTTTLLLSVWLSLPLLLMAQPSIQTVTPNLSQVGQYEKFEVALALTATYTNAYAYDQIVVSGVFTGPGGQVKTVDGFFMKEYSLDPSGVLNQTGWEGFKLRFAPDQAGTWTYQLSVSDGTGTATDGLRSFECVASAVPGNKGFVRSNASKYLTFDNGDPYVPVGQNVAWQVNNPYIDYNNWLGKMAAKGGNFYRLWHAHWGLGIEWRTGWNNFLGLRKYKETNSRYQDWLFDYSAEKGMYAMLCIQHHGQVSSQVNPNWSDSPYNAANGGPCQNTWDFFTHATAKAHTRNRLRYIVARWGYARSIMAWELFNEVDWTDQYVQRKADVANWHEEMAAYLKQIDPYGHLVTTSFAYADRDPLVWTLPDIDLTQTHYYNNTPNLERLLVGAVRSYRDLYDKPTLTGEFGLGASPPLASEDPNGIHIHNGLWGALFGGGFGTGMSWWWDSYIEPRNLYYHYDAVASVAADMPFAEKNMAPRPALVSGAPGDLSLTPGLDWGVIADDSIAISATGQITPESPALSRFLYGSQWNTQFRSPPTFYVNYPAAGHFSVKTGTATGAAPQIAIWLDGSIALQQNAQQVTTYSISVPAGTHTLKVDNTGTDWITIAAYTFTGLGSKADAYVLAAADSTVAAGWVLSNQYNHTVVPQSGAPAALNGVTVTVEGFRDGQYYAKWYDCLTGAITGIEAVTVSSQQLVLSLPNLHWDLAFRVDDQVVNPTGIREIAATAFQLYPNPAAAGTALVIRAAAGLDEPLYVSLLDVAGRQVHTWGTAAVRRPGAEWEVALAEGLPPGFYWLKIAQGGKATARPLVVRD